MATLLFLFACPVVQADDAPVRFELQGRAHAAAAVQANGGFELQARLTPSRKSAEGGGYAIDAVATPAGSSCSASDVIFADGFE
ncbi:MAG: hypothetical protein EOP90_11105 [Lysobacteraceae bacterium]|nr:MAG: hypothetical protein EOP90_11105 [Xanthomonadaceae bacterium]